MRAGIIRHRGAFPTSLAPSSFTPMPETLRTAPTQPSPHAGGSRRDGSTGLGA